MRPNRRVSRIASLSELRLVAIVVLPLISGGCIAWDVATLPVKATSKAVDWTSTSRDEADRERKRQAADICGHRSGDCRGADGVPVYFERVEQTEPLPDGR